MNQENDELPEHGQNPEVVQISEQTIDSLINNARSQHHIYRQRGPWIVCTSCVSQHASFIGVNRDYKGVDEDGKPVLKKRER